MGEYALFDPGYISIFIGFALLLFPFLYTICGEKTALIFKVTIPLSILNNYSKVIAAGIIFILLGLLYLMGIIPWITTL